MQNNAENLTVLDRATALAKIKSIAGRSNTLRADIDLVCRSAFLHAAEHGDLTLASKLHAAVSKSYKSDVKRYFITFAPVYFDSKSGEFKKAKKGGRWDLSALETPFDAVEKPEKPTAEYSRDKVLSSIVKFLDTKSDQAINADDAEMVQVLGNIAGVLARLIDAE